MKKLVSMSLVAALALTGATAAFAKENEKGSAHQKAEVKAEAKADVQAETTADAEQTEQTEQSRQQQTGKPAAVQLKKQLIELRQELKQATEVSAEQKAKYESLVSELEKLSDKSQALEVQLELLERYYQKGDKQLFDKLGQLLEATGNQEVKAFVDGKLVKSDVAPFLQGGRTLVPVRAISAALKADVKWDAAARTVVITRGDRSITLYLDKKEALVNGAAVTLEITPVLKKGRVFLPLRFVGEQLNANVDWQAKGKIVIIDDAQTEQTATQK